MKSMTKTIAIAVLNLCFIASVHADPTVSQIAAGAGFVLFMKTDGSLWTAGYNADGQTANPVTYIQSYPYYQSFPIEVVSNGVTAIAAGQTCSLFIKSDESLWGMGDDGFGQLGVTPYLGNTNVPEQIVGSNVVAVSTGYGHTIYRAYSVTGPLGNQTITMRVAGMGYDIYGQLGNYSTKSGDYYPSPVTIEFDSTKFFPLVTPVCAGRDSSFFVKTDGSLWAMGFNGEGQLGDGTTNIPPGVEQVPGAANVTAVAMNGATTLFLESDGSLWTMGNDTGGQGGEGTTDVPYYATPQKIVGSNVTAISAGWSHNLFLKTDGTLWGMGINYYGELGPNSLNHYFPSPRLIASNVVNFAAGFADTYYTKSDGTTWAMGINTYGQLGNGFVNDVSTNAEQIFPYRPAMFTGMTFVTPTNVQITATCPVGGIYYLLTSTDLKVPVASWGAIYGGGVATRGPNNFSFTIGIGPSYPNRYYALVRSD